MYKCEDLQIGDGVIKASYGIEYVWLRAFIEDNQCKIKCLLEDINDCNIIKAFSKFEITAQKEIAKRLALKQLDKLQTK